MRAHLADGRLACVISCGTTSAGHLDAPPFAAVLPARNGMYSSSYVPERAADAGPGHGELSTCLLRLALVADRGSRIAIVVHRPGPPGAGHAPVGHRYSWRCDTAKRALLPVAPLLGCT